MSKVRNVKILKNLFGSSDLKRIHNVIQLVNWTIKPQLIMKQLQNVTPTDLLWIIGENPAYYLQYQVKSSAILRIQNLSVIVIKPKYIQYPMMVKFPDLGEKKINNLVIEVVQKSTKATQKEIKALIDYVQLFYGTYFHTDQNFETNLLTSVKHYISRITKCSYWHGIMDQTNKAYVSNEDQIQTKIKLRITGCKQGYDQQLFMFSKKGERRTIFWTIYDKFGQFLSFMMMLMIFVTVVTCNDDDQGICEHKDKLMVGGAAMMMGLMGMRIANRKKNKRKT